MTVTAMPPTTTATETAPVKKSKKKLIIIIVAVLALGGGGYTFMKPKPAGPPVAGDVLKLDAIQINLASAHYLRIGLALQLIAGVKETDGSKALDAAITTFSGLSMADVNSPTKRETLRKQLETMLEKRYEHEVMGVYFTELVTQ